MQRLAEVTGEVGLEFRVARGAGGGDGRADAARAVRPPRHAGVELLRPVAREDEVGVGVDEARDDRPATCVDPIVSGGCFALITGPHDAVAFDDDGRVLDQSEGGFVTEGGVVGDQGGDVGDERACGARGVGGADGRRVAHGVLGGLVGGGVGFGGGGGPRGWAARGHPRRASTASARAFGTSGTREWAPSRTTCRPPTTVCDTSAADAANTAVSAPSRGSGPAVLTESSAMSREVGERTGLQGARVRPAEGRVAVGRGRPQQGRGRPVASGAGAQALVQLHGARLFEQVDHGVAVGAEGERGAFVLQGDGGSDAVGQVPLGGGAHAGAGAAAADEGDVLGGEVGVVDAGGARTQDAVQGEQLGRGAAVGLQAGVVLGGLLGQVHVQRGPPLLGPPRDGRQLVGGHGPYGVDRRSDPRVIPFLEN